jgi:hypothetical protein
MEPINGRGLLPQLDEDAQAFQVMVAASMKFAKTQPSQFVKNIEEMPKVTLPPISSKRKVLALAN